jgi:hypothetical protein
MVKDANDELNTRRQDMVNKYVPDILKIVKAIGEAEKFTMIVDIMLCRLPTSATKST